jgi:hypothetical protein
MAHNEKSAELGSESACFCPDFHHISKVPFYAPKEQNQDLDSGLVEQCLGNSFLPIKLRKTYPENKMQNKS